MNWFNMLMSSCSFLLSVIYNKLIDAYIVYGPGDLLSIVTSAQQYTRQNRVGGDYVSHSDRRSEIAWEVVNQVTPLIRVL